MNFVDTKKAVASMMGHTAVSQVRYVPADFIINSFDMLAAAINDARQTIEKAWDFQWSQTDALLSIAATGGDISTATTLTPSAISIKRVSDVLLPIGGSKYLPVEFLTNDNYLKRIRSQVGRQLYSSTATEDYYGIGETNATAVIQGKTISLTPASMFSFPVTAKLSVVQFMPDYSSDADHDFFLDIGAECIKWLAIVKLNRLSKNFSVMPAEGDVKEPMDLAQMAFEALVKWDISLNAGTSTPAIEIPQLPRPPQPEAPQQ